MTSHVNPSLLALLSFLQQIKKSAQQRQTVLMMLTMTTGTLNLRKKTSLPKVIFQSGLVFSHCKTQKKHQYTVCQSH